MGVLTGYRVVDLSIAMAGPLAAMRLGDLGADVSRSSRSAANGNATPAGGATGNEVNASFLALNRNKRSLAVDLKSPDGQERRAARSPAPSDVFLQNYRPGVAERLGVDYESRPRGTPELVYVSISGYGETRPYANGPGRTCCCRR